MPPAQYLPHYTFFTDPTYPETNLVVVRVRDPQTGTMPDVTLDCAGTARRLAAGRHERQVRVDARRPVDRRLPGRRRTATTACTRSRSASSSDRHLAVDAALGVTVWGWGNDVTWPTDSPMADETNPKFTRWVSYGYPAGANFKPLNTPYSRQSERIPSHAERLLRGRQRDGVVDGDHAPLGGWKREVPEAADDALHDLLVRQCTPPSAARETAPAQSMTNFTSTRPSRPGLPRRPFS